MKFSKKIVFILILLILLVIIPTYAITIDQAVEEKLEEDDEVSVIVLLKDKPVKAIKGIKQVATLENKKAMIKQQQKNVLDKLNVKYANKKTRITTLESEVFDLELRHQYSAVNGFSGKITKQGLEKLKQDPNVESIHINGVKHILLAQSVPLINGDDVWRIKLNNTNITGRGETICVIDTGIDTDHTAFDNRILDQYCYCQFSDHGSGGCCPDNTVEDDSAEDDYGHGTHCAGIAAGNYSSTIRGVAPEAGIVAIKVCDSGGDCNDDDVIAGIDWCTNNASKYNISVISMSLGGGGPFNSYCDSDVNATAFADAINSAVGQNISVIVASGNDGWTSGISIPACVENATPIGSTNDGSGGTSADDISSFTNRGNILELMAPGKWITAPYNNGATATLQGTSMATPHVAGAAALLKQFVRLQNGSNITPEEIEDVLNRTGKSIYDSGSSRNYSRIDVYAAIQSLDTIPPIWSNNATSNTTPRNSDIVQFNITWNDTIGLSSYIFSWNDTGSWVNATNGTLTGTSQSITVNMTVTAIKDQVVYWKFYANDTNNNWNVTDEWSFTVQDTIGTAKNVTLNSTDSLNRTNGTLIGTWTFYDPDQDNQTNNETKWYNNSIEVTSLRNLTSIASGNTTKNQVWIFSVRVYDGTNWSNWENSSNLTINNAAPDLSIIKNITTVNETGLINITVNATDIDGDSFNYSINDSKFTQTNNSFTWQTNLTDSGTYTVRINVTDGTNSSYQDFVVTILNAPDFDGDGNPDLNDTDDDNDGLNDTSDKLKGNATNINSTVSVKLWINSSENTSQVFNNTLEINITDQNNVSLVQFNWNFTNSTLVINWTIDYSAANGTISIKNLDLTSQQLTKTVYINKSSSNYNYVCIADYDVDSINDVSSDCTNANETKLSCTGTLGQYNCTDLGSKFKVTGLNHSAVKGLYVSSGNGGNGGGGGRRTTQTCTENWNCTSWQPIICPNTSRQTRKCTDLNNCSTTINKPPESKVCYYYQPKEENITEPIINETKIIEINETITKIQVETEKDKLNIIPIISIPLLLILLLILIFMLIKRFHHKKRIHKTKEKTSQNKKTF